MGQSLVTNHKSNAIFWPTKLFGDVRKISFGSDIMTGLTHLKTSMRPSEASNWTLIEIVFLQWKKPYYISHVVWWGKSSEKPWSKNVHTFCVNIMHICTIIVPLSAGIIIFFREWMSINAQLWLL